MSNLKTLLVPVFVGAGSLFLIEDALEKVNNEKLRKKITSREFKILILFSAAYAANGTKVLPAIISLYLYHLITTNVVESNETLHDTCSDAHPISEGPNWVVPAAFDVEMLG
jgi:hypothetical protein